MVTGMYYIVVVIYQKKLDEIGSFIEMKNFCSRHSDTKIIVIDNSDRKDKTADDYLESVMHKNANRHEDENENSDYLIYIENGKNIGLSKAYNIAIKIALNDLGKKDINDGWMLFCDDDTKFSEKYFEHSKDITDKCMYKNRRIDIVTGLIDSGSRPLSPVKKYHMYNFKRNYIVKAGIYENAECINSGMAIRLSTLCEVGGYDEELFLDMTDHALFFKLKNAGCGKVLVMNEHVVQNFSGRNEKNHAARMRRYQIYKKDYMSFCHLTNRSRLYAFIEITKRRIGLELHRGV